MADLLGSILGSMEKPPSVDDEERKKRKAQKRRMEKIQEQEKDKLNKFREKMQKRIDEFVRNGTLEKQKFEPMDKVQRAIVHEVADIAGLSSFSFGIEEEDRYVMLWKKEFAPSDEELLAYRQGEAWDPEKAKEDARLKKLHEEELEKSRKESEQRVPNSNYHDKYKHLIGTAAAKDAAIITTANESYGNVPSENKTDRRTIEQVMADTAAKKRRKIDSELPGDTS